MTIHLVPFKPSIEPLLVLTCTANRSKQGSVFLRFECKGPLKNLITPPLQPPPGERKDQLWEHTCFEAFLSTPGHPGYQEINLSPSGAWNCYLFESYRQGMTQAPTITQIQIQVQSKSDLLILTAEVPLSPSLTVQDGPLEVGLTAVLEFRGGIKEYWACTHAGPQPDFHKRESFTEKL